MKRLIGMGFILLLWAFAAGCGTEADSGEPATTPTQTAPPSNRQGETNGFVLDYNGAKLAMGQDMEDALNAIGEPISVFESQSCAFEGVDRIYKYSGLEINTYPDSDRDYILNIIFKDDSVTTTEGIYLGSSLAEVTDAYGDDYEQDMGLYTYTKGKSYLSFLIEDDSVASIVYGFTVDL